MSALANNIFSSVERGLLPDALIRAGIRKLCRERLQEITVDDATQANERLFKLVEQMHQSTIALVPAGMSVLSNLLILFTQLGDRFPTLKA